MKNFTPHATAQVSPLKINNKKFEENILLQLMETKNKLLLLQRSTAKFIGNTSLATDCNECGERNYKIQEADVYEKQKAQKTYIQYPT